jgi:proteic killer suppression protein
MIKSFRHKGLKRLFESGSKKGVPPKLADKIIRRLDALESAVHPLDLYMPGFDLHELSGDRQGTWSINLTANWRLTFRFKAGDAFDVDLEDYH